MKPYCLKFIPEEELVLFLKIKAAVEQLEDPDLGVDGYQEPIPVSCHMIARAVAELFSVTLKDGFYIVGYQHSWLVTATGHVIDVYPVGMLGGPILCENTSVLSPARRLYHEVDPEVESITYEFFKEAWFLRSVQIVTDALRKAVTTSNEKIQL